MTILFEEDWKKHKGATLQTNTRNTSFIRICKILKDMGVKNYRFPLALHDSSLINVDPHSQTLTEDQCSRIAAECKTNYWYYLREVARAPEKSGEKSTPIRATRMLIYISWCYLNHVPFFIVAPRQCGKSFGIDLLKAWVIGIAGSNVSFELLTQNETLRRKSSDELKALLESLPKFLTMFNPKKDLANPQEITVKRLGNKYRLHLGNKSEDNARKAARGLTSPSLHSDETATTDNVRTVLSAAIPALGEAREIAKRAGAPYGIIYSTTAGKIDDRDGQAAFNIYNSGVRFTELLYDCKDVKELEARVRANSREGKFQISATYNHRQVGRTDAWLKQNIEEAGLSKDEADRDYFNVWTCGTQLSPFTPDQTKVINSSMKETVYPEITGKGYIVRWFVSEAQIDTVMSEATVLGMDTSEAIGQDDIAFHLRSIKDGKTIATGNYNETNIISFSEWICELMLRYPKMILIPERRSTGSSVIDYLLKFLFLHGIDPFRRIYNTIVNDSNDGEKELKKYEEINVSSNRMTEDLITKNRKSFGFSTSGSGKTSRDSLYSKTLHKATDLTGKYCYDQTLINQLLGLENRNGRIDHAKDGNDDNVIAWLLSFWLLTQGTNLQHYGIDPKDVLSVIAKESNKDISPQEKFNNHTQTVLRDKLAGLLKQLQVAVIPMHVERLNVQIQTIMSKVKLGSDEILAVDNLLTGIKEAQEQQRLTQQRRKFA